MPGNKGVALSIDALLAMVIFIAMAAYLATEPMTEMPVTQSITAANLLVDDAIAAMDNTGFIMQSIESSQEELITAKLDGLLPSNVAYRLELTKYVAPIDLPGNQCREKKEFAECFPEDGNVFFVTDLNVPEDREVFHGFKIFVKKEPGDCGLSGVFSEAQQKKRAAMLLGNYIPEARDANITTGASCPATVNPCPTTLDTMRCCYEYYDGDGNPEADVEYAWYKYDPNASGDKWVIEAGETAEAVSGLLEGERWKCKVRVNDGSEWSNDANSPFAIVGGPCFQYSSSISPEPMKCGTTSSVSFSVTAEAGERQEPADIMLSMDRSGSMSWMGVYENATGIEASVFLDEDSGYGYLGTTTNPYSEPSSYVYKIDVNLTNGDLAYDNRSKLVDNAWDLFVDGSYVYVANGGSGIMVLDRDDLGSVRNIGGMTTARGIFVSGDYIYAGAAGTVAPDPITVYDASMTNSREDDERVGYSSTQSWVAQSFVTGIGDINGVRVYLRKYGSPNDLNVHLRETIDGEDLPNGTVVVSAGSISTSYGWVDIEFPGGVDVNIGQAYYIVLTTTSQSSSSYYRVGSRSRPADPYPYGSIYRCDSSGSCTAMEPPNQSKYEDALFRIYKYDYMVGGIVIIDKSHPNPSNWEVVGNLYDTGVGYIDYPGDLVVSGDYAYATDKAGGDGTEGLWVVDVSDRANPVVTDFLALTNPQAVAVSGDYAFLADEDSGLRIVNVQNKSDINLSTTMTGIGTVTDVAIYDTNLYVMADIGSGPTAYGVHVFDAANPESISLIDTFYAPYVSAKISVGENYILIGGNDTRGLRTMDRVFGTKMNFSRNSAKSFVNYDDWDSPLDQIGVVSYGGSLASLDQELILATEANKEIINSEIDTIMALGSTPMTSGLEEAIDELLGARGRSEAIQFIVMLADGQCNVNCAWLNTQIQRARSNGIYVFTIGLGGDVDDTQLQNIAYGAYCPDQDNNNCGSYHHVLDPDALTDIYEIIAQDIARLSGIRPDDQATDITMQFTEFAGLGLSNFEPSYSSWDGTTLVYEDLNIDNGWTGSFDALIPCNYEGCGNDFNAGREIWFPPGTTSIEFNIDGVEQGPVDWPEKYRAGGEFYFNDISIGFVSGTFYGVEDSTIKYSISNIGYYDVDLSGISPTISFYKDDDSPLFACEEPLIDVGSESIEWDLNAAHGVDAGPDTSIDRGTALMGSGYICMWLNKGQNPVVDCNANNRIVVHCAVPQTYVYALDYWAWEK